MTMHYTPREDRMLAEDRAKDAAIKEEYGHKPASSVDRERLWKAIQDTACG